MKVILNSGVKIRVNDKEAEFIMEALMDYESEASYISFKNNGVRDKVFKLSDISAVI